MFAAQAALSCFFCTTATRLPGQIKCKRMARLSSPNRAAASASTSESPSSRAEGGRPKPWLLVGLGNPGKMYNGTRHNVGFEMLDAIADGEGISVSSVRFKALLGKGQLVGFGGDRLLEPTRSIRLLVNGLTSSIGQFSSVLMTLHQGFIGDFPVVLAKPQTFMNASGESVSQVVSYYNIPLTQILLMYDDMDLPFASLRLLPKGGHGGHNGMRSVIDHLGTRDFPRLRIGIGRPPGKMDPVNFVLRPFSKKEREELDFTLQTGLEAVRMLLLEGFDKSATYVNSSNSKILN